MFISDNLFLYKMKKQKFNNFFVKETNFIMKIEKKKQNLLLKINTQLNPSLMLLKIFSN